MQHRTVLKKTLKAPIDVIKFISFEGLDGSGKSTQMALLEDHLRSCGENVLSVREPGSTYIGDQIRHLLQHDKNAVGMFPETEILLFEASRAQLVRECILPALKDGNWVLCDRFIDSTTAYQGATQRLSERKIQWLNSFAAATYTPSMTFLFEVPLTIRQQRIQERSEEFDRINYQAPEFFEAVAEIYHKIAAKEPERFVHIDAKLPPKDIAKLIQGHIAQHFFSNTAKFSKI